MAKIDTIRIWRGPRANLPALLDGELAYTEDTNQLYIGTSGGSNSLLVNPTGGLTSLIGDVTASGTGAGTATVVTVGGSTAAAIHTAVLATQAAASANTAGVIVSRDGSGNFAAGTITANLTGTASTATAPQTGSAHGAVTLDTSGHFQSVAPGVAGHFLRSNGTDYVDSAIQVSDVPAIPVTGISATGTPSSGNYLRGDGVWTAPGGTGTVTSIALAAPTEFTVSGSPVTTSGTLTFTKATQTANTVWAAPDGVAGAPTFRALLTSDIPTLNQSTTGNAATATAPAAGSGHGAVTLDVSGHFQSVAPGSAGNYMRSNGTDYVASTIQAADVPVLNQNTTGTAANITASSNATLTTLSALSLPGTQVTGNISGNAANVTGTVGTGSGGTGVTSVTTAPTASSFAGWDANKNLSGNNFIDGYATTVTAAGTTTLTVSSAGVQNFTGTTTQTVKLPVATTLVNGQSFVISNQSTGAVTVETSGLNTLVTVAANQTATVTCVNTAGGTGTASWNYTLATQSAGGSGTVTSVTFTGDGTVLSSTASSAVTTSGTVTAALKTQTANTVLAGPSSGSAANPTFRALVNADVSGLLSQPFDLSNLGLSVSVATNVLTVALKQADGSTDPSASSAVRIGFRSATATSGAYAQRTVTSALSVNTVAAGASFGLVSGQAQYVHVYALDNAGAVELALAGSRIFDEGSVQSTTAIGAGSTSSSVLYSTTARTNVPVRYIGRILVNEATAGTYASAATEVTVWPTDRYRQERSEIWVDSATGGSIHGSTNTCILRFANVTKTSGSAITLTQSATNGDSFAVNEDGIYSVTASQNVSSGTSDVGISLNSSQLTTNVSSITAATRLAGVEASAGIISAASWTGVLKAGDVVRAHDNGLSTGTANWVYFKICQVSR